MGVAVVCTSEVPAPAWIVLLLIFYQTPTILAFPFSFELARGQFLFVFVSVQLNTSGNQVAIMAQPFKSSFIIFNIPPFIGYLRKYVLI